METPLIFSKVAFIGLGLIGGSLAKLIHHQLPDTQLMALDKPDIINQAQAEQVIHTQLKNLEDPALFEADLIILGTHLDDSERILKTLSEEAKKPIYVMDLGSVKTPICHLAETLSDNLIFIGGHPMAGKEVSGFLNSHWNLFLAKRFLLTPCQKTTSDFQENITSWLHQLGMVPVLLEKNRHDELMALVSHFPQFYAVALANLLYENNPAETLQFLGGGIDDQMRLMASPDEMWQPVFLKNKNNLEKVLAQFIEIITDMKNKLSADENLKQAFGKSHEIYTRYQQEKNR